VGELYSISHIVPSSAGSSIPRKLNILSLVKLLLSEVSSFSGIVSGYRGSCLGDMAFRVSHFNMPAGGDLQLCTMAMLASWRHDVRSHVMQTCISRVYLSECASVVSLCSICMQ
jgi:hypothetical protein